MFKYLRKMVKNHLALIDQIPISSDEKARLQHYSVFLLAGIPTMMVFGVYNMIAANFLIYSLLLLSAGGLISGWFFLRKARNGRIIYQVNAAIFSLLLIYLLISGGEAGSLILWIYIFPLISFFLLGKNEGLFWNASMYLIAALLLWNPFSFSFIYDYPVEIKIRFLPSYAIVSAVTYWFEYFRSYYRRDIELKNQSLQQEITERKAAELEREKLIKELQNALSEVKTLSGLFPICSSCKKIRDDRGYWNQIESYIRERSNAEFSHSICPDCREKLYPEFHNDDKRESR